jgi:segregation and condensation protein A
VSALLPSTAPVEIAPEETPPVPLEAAERVLGYLVFHKALLDDTAEAEGRRALLERYLALVRDLKEGVHIVIDDPQEKATALLFELVLDQAFDPWEIDLVRFTQAYLERLRGDGAFDFAVSGRLVYMAWSILYLQSRELLLHHETPAPAAPEALPEMGPDDGNGGFDDGYLGELTTPEAVAVTSAVLDSPVPPPLEEMIRHSETRPVSLLELVSAFGSAEAEARRALRLEELRDRLREQQRAPPEVLVHGDVPERDLEDAWEVCRAQPKETPFPFLSLWRASEGRDRLVALFLATLFLAREKVIDMRQATLGESPVELVRLEDARPARAPGAPKDEKTP